MEVPRFPFSEPLFVDKGYTPDIFGEVETILLDGKCQEGFLQVVDRERLTTFFLLFYKSATYVAGRYKDKVFKPLKIRDFFDEMFRGGPKNMSMYRTDPILLLLVAVHFQHRPNLQAASNLVDVRQVFSELEVERHNAAVDLAKGEERNLMILRGGKPVKIFYADPAFVPQEVDIADQAVTLLRTAGEAGGIEVYHDMKISPAKDSGQPFTSYLARDEGPPKYLMIVRKSGKEVERRIVQTESLRIGRADTCDLALDDLNVSREHACILWKMGGFVLKDLDSANGTIFRDQKVHETPIMVGDSFVVGEHEIELAQPQKVSERKKQVSDSQTLIMMPTLAFGRLVHQGKDVKLIAMETKLGSGSEADVAIKGLLVKPIQAKISRTPEGKYQLTDEGGMRGTKVNGKKVKQVVLTDGDEIRIGSEALVFHFEE